MNNCSIQFYLRGTDKKGAQKQPIYLRVTINSQPSILKSIKESVKPSQWDKSRQRVIKSKDFKKEAEQINDIIDNLYYKVKTVVDKYNRDLIKLSGKQLRDEVLPKEGPQLPKPQTHTILKLFPEYVAYKLKHTPTSRHNNGTASSSTERKFKAIHTKLQELIINKYNRKDLKLDEVPKSLLRDYATSYEAGADTKRRFNSCLVKFFDWLEEKSKEDKANPIPGSAPLDFKNECLAVNWHDVTFKHKPTEAKAHTPEEVKKIKAYFLDQVSKGSINLDLLAYLFQIETGMSAIDLLTFNFDDHVFLDTDGYKWVKKRRGKYDYKDSEETVFTVPLSEFAEHLLSLNPSGNFSALGDSDAYRHRLQPHSKRFGFRLRPHKSRHTFGVTKLNEGFRLESVKKMLGHTDLQSTLIYAKMGTIGIKEDLNRIRESNRSNGSSSSIKVS